MKVYEAIELLKGCDPENELVVLTPLDNGFGIPAHRKLSNRSFFDGFDWGKGFTFIRVAFPKGQPND